MGKFLFYFIILLVLFSGCDKSVVSEIEEPVFDYNLIYPKHIGTNGLLPLVMIDPYSNPRSSDWETFQISSAEANLNPTEFTLKRGRGSALIQFIDTSNITINLINGIGVAVSSLTVSIDSDTNDSEFSGILQDESLYWDSTSTIHLIDDVFIPDGQTLTIGAGVRVELDLYVSIVAEGNIVCQGTEEAPVLFISHDAENSWGEIKHSGSTGEYEFTFFVNGGGDASKSFGHSGSQPVIREIYVI